MSPQNEIIYTIGHSTHPIDLFIDMLTAYEIQTLVDVRTIPRSRYNPQFNAEALAEALSAGGITYRSLKALGGLRHPQKDSLNQGWRNESFRGYADYMQSQAFVLALAELRALAQNTRTAIMCAEAAPSHCHRSLIADALTVQTMPVVHILSATQSKPHEITPFAQIVGQSITYPAVQPILI